MQIVHIFIGLFFRPYGPGEEYIVVGVLRAFFLIDNCPKTSLEPHFYLKLENGLCCLALKSLTKALDLLLKKSSPADKTPPRGYFRSGETLKFLA